MKSFLIYLTLVCFCPSAFSQGLVEELREFYIKADLNCYIDKAQQRMMKQYDWFCQRDTTFNSFASPPDTNFDKSNTVPILNVQFVNTENYNYPDNIYDYITIDSVWAFTFARIDKQMKVYAYANFPAPFTAYLNIKEKKSKQLIKNIKKKQPDLILYCSALDGGFGEVYNNGFMYVKSNDIYMYDKFHGRSYELNEYLQKFLKLNEIHSLNYSVVPLLFQKDGDSSTRRTGNAPLTEIIYCKD